MDFQNSTQQYYREHAEAFVASTLDVNMGELYRCFLPLLPPKGRILDAGCGSGRDSKHFQSLGFDVSAFDASPELACLASILLNTRVKTQTFQQLNEHSRYDGIWCCASLLHVPNIELSDVMVRLNNALRPQGVLYASFKYGNQEREQGGRFFCDQNEQTLQTLITLTPTLIIDNTWVTTDQRVERSHEKWLNVIMKKTG